MLVEKFKKSEAFLSDFWKGADSICVMEEKTEADILRESGSKALRMTLKKLSGGLKLSDNQKTKKGQNEFDYCMEILSNVPYIKLKVLDILKFFLEVIYQVSYILVDICDVICRVG